MSNEINKLYEFGEFRLDTKDRILFRGEETIILPAKVFETLQLLVEQKGAIVSKENLMDSLWEDSFVEEGNLTQNIYLLRQAIGKDAIETVPRRGYRFALPAKEIVLSNEKLNNNVIGSAEDSLGKKVEKSNEQAKSGRSWYRLAPILGGAFLLFAIAGLLAFNSDYIGNSSSKKNSVNIKSLTDSGNVENAAISPNGEFLAYTTVNKAKDRVFHLRDLKSDQDVSLNTSSVKRPSALRFSPSGDHIYFTSRGNNTTDIYRVTRFGGNPERQIKDVASEFSFSKDGKTIAFVRVKKEDSKHQLITRDLESGEEKVVLEKEFPEGFSLITAPAWSNNGKTIYVVSRRQGAPYSSLEALDLATGESKAIKTPKWMRAINQVETSPSEDSLILVGWRIGAFGQLYKLSVSTGAVERITNDLNNYRKISLSSDAKLIVARQLQTSSNLRLLPEGKTENIKDLTRGSKGRFGRQGLEVLPDEKLLFVSIEGKNRDIWTLDLENNAKTQLTKEIALSNQNPFVDPENGHIYFVSSKKGIRQIKRMDLDGGNIIEITSGKDYTDFFPAKVPNENALYFIRKKGGLSSIWKKALPDGEETQIDSGIQTDNFRYLTISPDGKYIALRVDGNAQGVGNPELLDSTLKIAVASIEKDDFKPKVFTLPSQRMTIRWNAESDAIDFIENTSEGSKIHRQKVFEDTPSEIVADLPKIQVMNFAWMPNGKDLAIADTNVKNDVILLSDLF